MEKGDGWRGWREENEKGKKLHDCGIEPADAFSLNIICSHSNFLTNQLTYRLISCSVAAKSLA